jgi:hypothetical protein
MGLALQLRQEFFDSGGWTSVSSRFPHRVPHALVAFFDRLRWRHLLYTKGDYSSAMYSTTGYSTTLFKITYLRRRGLRDLHLLRHPLLGGVARLPRRRSKASLQASRRVLNKWHMRQAWTAKPRPQLEAVLKNPFVFFVVIGGILHDDGVVAFTDFAALLHLPHHRDLDPARWRLRLGDKPPHIILRKDIRRRQLYYKY